MARHDSGDRGVRRPDVRPLRLDPQPLGQGLSPAVEIDWLKTPGAKALGVVLFAALTALAAQVSLPMVPVPMTLQSLAVILAGGFLGPRGGVAAMGLYLAAAAVGLPVLSDGRSGMAALTGPTAGYLAGFVLAAWASGEAGRRGWLKRPVEGAALFSATHLLILLPGAAWLALDLGWPVALAGGFTPFLIGAVVKSAAAWLILAGLARRG